MYLSRVILFPFLFQRRGIIFLISLFMFLFFSFPSFATRIDTSLEVMKEIAEGKNSLFLPVRSFYISSAKTYNTQHFTIYYGENDPATTLWADYNKDGIPDFITNVADILEYVWEVEIEDMEFKTPKGYLPIPVYIANTGIYVNGEELTLSENICGFSLFDGTQSYIVLNATPPSSFYTKPMDMLKVTVAHEFFHLIQYAYKIDLDSIDLWFYEGTATWMENQVYPDINDYIYSYADSIFSSPELGLLYSEGLHPYGTSLFFDFLSQKFGNTIIKEVWQTFPLVSNGVEAIDKVLKEKGSSLHKEIYNFYYSLLYDKNSFSDGDLLDGYESYLGIDTLNCDEKVTVSIRPLGAKYILNSCDVISALSYNTKSIFIADNTVLSGIAINTEDEKGVIVYSNSEVFNSTEISSESVYLQSEYVDNIQLNDGWNLVGFKGKVLVESLNKPEIVSVWKWNGENWEIFIPDYYPEIKETAEKYGIKQFNETEIGEGIWINAKESIELENAVFYGGFSFSLYDSWSLVSFPAFTDLNLEDLASIYPIESIWKWEDNSWEIFVPANETELLEIVNSYGIETFNEIGGKESIGFWIKKK